MPDKFPPIPPGCEYFKLLAPKMDGNHVYGFRMGSEICHLDCAQPRRGIIAAVAEVAWRREADRAMKASRQSSGPALSDAFGDFNVATDNACAWRAWGESDNADR